MCCIIILFTHSHYITVVGYAARIGQQIETLKMQFVELKSAICVALNSARIDFYDFLSKLSGLPVLLEGVQPQFVIATINKMFSLWDYMHPEIYTFIVEMFSLESCIPMLAIYQDRLDHFLTKTPTEVFCRLDTRERNIRIPPGFTAMGVRGALGCHPNLFTVKLRCLIFAIYAY